tara:strand:- start:55 stop:1050 length:996 start_codon:yes stop_codon:yes gene_type:complete
MSMIQLLLLKSEFKKFLLIILIFSLISFLQFFLLIKIIDKGDQVSIRDLLFTSFVQDRDIQKINNALNEINYEVLGKVEKNFYLTKLDKKLQQLLISIKNVRDIDTKVEILLNNFSPSFNLNGTQCNEKTDLIYNINNIFTEGLGCCSDYARASIFLLNILNIRAREVNNYRHTSIEYYNEDKKKWIWIDPSYRIYAYSGNDRNKKLDLFEIFSSNIGESIFFQFANKNLLDFKPLIEIYHHQPQQYGSISYSLSVDNDGLRDKIIDFGIHKSLVDLVYLFTGINKGKLTIMPTGNNFIFSKIAQIFSYIFIILIILINLLITKFLLKKLI